MATSDVLLDCALAVQKVGALQRSHDHDQCVVSVLPQRGPVLVLHVKGAGYDQACIWSYLPLESVGIHPQARD